LTGPGRRRRRDGAATLGRGGGRRRSLGALVASGETGYVVTWAEVGARGSVCVLEIAYMAYIISIRPLKFFDDSFFARKQFCLGWCGVGV